LISGRFKVDEGGGCQNFVSSDDEPGTAFEVDMSKRRKEEEEE